MEFIPDQSELIIKPTSQFAKEFIEEFIRTNGTHQLNDAIRKAISSNSYSLDQLTLKFNGIYPNDFKSAADAQLFKESVETLVSKTNSNTGNFRIANIDDVLFILYFIVGHQGDIYGSTAQSKYLDELIDVFLSLLKRKLTSTDDEYIWIPDGITGIDTQIPRTEFSEKELKMNGGYHTISRMIGPNNEDFHIASDSPILIDKRELNEEQIVLPRRLSEKIIANVIDHIIEEHKKADTPFYHALSQGHIKLFEWENRTKVRKYRRSNKVLYHLIRHIEQYFHTNSKFKLVTKDIHVFVYDLFYILNLILPPYKIDPVEKYSVIRTMLRDNLPGKGK